MIFTIEYQSRSMKMEMNDNETLVNINHFIADYNQSTGDSYEWYVYFDMPSLLHLKLLRKLDVEKSLEANGVSEHDTLLALKSGQSIEAHFAAKYGNINVDPHEFIDPLLRVQDLKNAIVLQLPTFNHPEEFQLVKQLIPLREEFPLSHFNFKPHDFIFIEPLVPLVSGKKDSSVLMDSDDIVLFEKSSTNPFDFDNCDPQVASPVPSKRFTPVHDASFRTPPKQYSPSLPPTPRRISKPKIRHSFKSEYLSICFHQPKPKNDSSTVKTTPISSKRSDGMDSFESYIQQIRHENETKSISIQLKGNFSLLQPIHEKFSEYLFSSMSLSSNPSTMNLSEVIELSLARSMTIKELRLKFMELFANSSQFHFSFFTKEQQKVSPLSLSPRTMVPSSPSTLAFHPFSRTPPPSPASIFLPAAPVRIIQLQDHMNLGYYFPDEDQIEIDSSSPSRKHRAHSMVDPQDDQLIADEKKSAAVIHVKLTETLCSRLSSIHFRLTNITRPSNVEPMTDQDELDNLLNGQDYLFRWYPAPGTASGSMITKRSENIEFIPSRSEIIVTFNAPTSPQQQSAPMNSRFSPFQPIHDMHSPMTAPSQPFQQHSLGRSISSSSVSPAVSTPLVRPSTIYCDSRSITPSNFQDRFLIQNISIQIISCSHEATGKKNYHRNNNNREFIKHFQLIDYSFYIETDLDDFHFYKLLITYQDHEHIRELIIPFYTIFPCDVINHQNENARNNHGGYHAIQDPLLYSPFNFIRFPPDCTNLPAPITRRIILCGKFPPLYLPMGKDDHKPEILLDSEENIELPLTFFYANRCTLMEIKRKLILFSKGKLSYENIHFQRITMNQDFPSFYSREEVESLYLHELFPENDMIINVNCFNLLQNFISSCHFIDITEIDDYSYSIETDEEDVNKDAMDVCGGDIAVSQRKKPKKRGRKSAAEKQRLAALLAQTEKATPAIIEDDAEQNHHRDGDDGDDELVHYNQKSVKNNSKENLFPPSKGSATAKSVKIGKHKAQVYEMINDYSIIQHPEGFSIPFLSLKFDFQIIFEKRVLDFLPNLEDISIELWVKGSNKIIPLRFHHVMKANLLAIHCRPTCLLLAGRFYELVVSYDAKNLSVDSSLLPPNEDGTMTQATTSTAATFRFPGKSLSPTKCHQSSATRSFSFSLPFKTLRVDGNCSREEVHDRKNQPWLPSNFSKRWSTPRVMREKLMEMGNGVTELVPVFFDDLKTPRKAAKKAALDPEKRKKSSGSGEGKRKVGRPPSKKTPDTADNTDKPAKGTTNKRTKKNGRGRKRKIDESSEEEYLEDDDEDEDEDLASCDEAAAIANKDKSNEDSDSSTSLHSHREIEFDSDSEDEEAEPAISRPVRAAALAAARKVSIRPRKRSRKYDEYDDGSSFDSSSDC